MPVNPCNMTDIRDIAFLARFVARGWLHATRENDHEQQAVDSGLRRGWLKRIGSEVHFTKQGRKAICD